MLLKLHYAKFDVSRLFCSKVIEEKPLRGRLDPPFGKGRVKGSNHCYIGDFGTIPGRNKTHSTGCIGEIIAFHKTLNDQETSYIQEYFMKKWVITDA